MKIFKVILAQGNHLKVANLFFLREILKFYACLLHFENFDTGGVQRVHFQGAFSRGKFHFLFTFRKIK